MVELFAVKVTLVPTVTLLTVKLGAVPVTVPAVAVSPVALVVVTEIL